MILLLGGTSETAEIAHALAQAGLTVLVSTATDVPLDIGFHPNISRRSGPLNLEGLIRLAEDSGVTVIVDASHPYASAVRFNAREAAEKLGVPYFTWVRPPVTPEEDFVIFADDHEEAARLACSFGQPVLLTTGSRNLLPYVAEASRTRIKLIARVLPIPDSRQACLNAGIPLQNIIQGRGPFSVEQNLLIMRQFGIGVLVTKDSGVAGGVPEKIEAARIQGCKLVVVRRPQGSEENVFKNVAELVSAVTEHH